MAAIRGMPGEDGGVVSAAAAMGRVGHGGVPGGACQAYHSTNTIPI